MKFNKSSINKNEVKTLNEDIVFSKVRDPLIRLEDVNVNADISLASNSEIINVYFKIKCTAILPCSYTLKPTPVKLEFNDSIDISEDINNLETYYVKGNVVDLNPIILDLIIGELPSKVISKGAKTHIEGDGYRVLSEEELRKEQEGNKTSPFDKLKDL